MPVRLPRPRFARSGLAGALICLAAAAAWASPEPSALASSATGAAATHHAAVAQPGPLAQFGSTRVSAGVREVANWAFFTRDNRGRAVVILDKHEATVYAFDPQGKLLATAPALLGLTIGDDTPPGVGDKPLSEIPEHERTTPAGRFIAQPGEDDTGVDVVWLDYGAAVAMHRVITTFPAQRRPERLASPDPKVRRISYGCINLPIPFYEQVLSPTVRKIGAVVYVLPETRPPGEVFGSWDVTDPAARPPAGAPAASARPASPQAHALRTAAAAAGF
ncbi:L,D-transpeptidase family protein [Ramlibacter alkalitolerans]|uniref:L,D-transpeptidase n=1 Tax=Ramlibacter alkalitolerans TaxID=2039631 RepID=A0ABS1JMG1_9BURK|nr:L,D-transpeptidase [Ramlibacter alkalitolerans]MBL0425388.1 L,D-transpeptidase [Ramlibacter alkalitolerans]